MQMLLFPVSAIHSTNQLAWKQDQLTDRYRNKPLLCSQHSNFAWDKGLFCGLSGSTKEAQVFVEVNLIFHFSKAPKPGQTQAQAPAQAPSPALALRPVAANSEYPVFEVRETPDGKLMLTQLGANEAPKPLKPNVSSSSATPPAPSVSTAQVLS